MYVPDNYDAYLEYERELNEDECRRRKREIEEERYDEEYEREDD